MNMIHKQPRKRRMDCLLVRGDGMGKISAVLPGISTRHGRDKTIQTLELRWTWLGRGNALVLGTVQTAAMIDHMIQPVSCGRSHDEHLRLDESF